MEPVEVDKNPIDPALLAAVEKRKTVNSIIGLVAILGLAALGCATIVLVNLINSGVWGG